MCLLLGDVPFLFSSPHPTPLRSAPLRCTALHFAELLSAPLSSTALYFALFRCIQLNLSPAPSCSLLSVLLTLIMPSSCQMHLTSLHSTQLHFAKTQAITLQSLALRDDFTCVLGKSIKVCTAWRLDRPLLRQSACCQMRWAFGRRQIKNLTLENIYKSGFFIIVKQ